MRPVLLHNRKFVRLVRLLDPHTGGFGQHVAIGVLEMLWACAYECGDDELGTPQNVEELAGWTGAPGVLFAALRDAGLPHVGFIEPSPDGSECWRIHDLYDHAPRYVKERMEREVVRTQNGTTISELRRAAGKKGGLAKASKHVASEQQTLANGQANTVTPAPAPAPAPRSAPTERAPAVAAAHSRADAPTLPGVEIPHTTKAAERPASKPSGSGSKKPGDPRAAPLLARLVAAFAEVRGAKYRVDGDRDGPAVKWLLGAGEAEDAIVVLWERALRSDEPFHRCDTIAQFASSRIWNYLHRDCAPAPSCKYGDPEEILCIKPDGLGLRVKDFKPDGDPAEVLGETALGRKVTRADVLKRATQKA